jgi:uncharacterized membrane protein YqjE
MPFALSASMAIVQALVAFIGRSFGKILSALFDWAVVAIFGYASGTEKTFLAVLLAAAGTWPLLLFGIIAPKVASFVLAFVPVPTSVPASTIRWVWVGLTLVVPLAVGAAMAARQPADQPRRFWPARLLRGLPITAGLSGALLITLVTVPALRLISAARRRKDVQVPLVTDVSSYGEVARRILTLQGEHGRPVRRVRPPWWLTAPLRILSGVDHEAFQSRVPADLAYFEGSGLALALYPSGLLIRGRPDALAVAQGLIVEGVGDLDVWQTSDPHAQAIERRISHLWRTVRAAGTGRRDPMPGEPLQEIVRAIEKLPVEYHDWQIVYRKALQLGRVLDGKPQLLDGLIDREETMRRGHERARMNGNNRAPSTMHLVGAISSQLVELAQIEVELVRTELASDARAGRRTLVGLGVAAVAALFGLNLLLLAVVLALATIMSGWMAAVLAAAVVLGTGAVIGYVGWRQRPRLPLALTRKSLREDWEWLKAQLA